MISPLIDYCRYDIPEGDDGRPRYIPAPYVTSLFYHVFERTCPQDPSPPEPHSPVFKE